MIKRWCHGYNSTADGSEIGDAVPTDIVCLQKLPEAASDFLARSLYWNRSTASIVSVVSLRFWLTIIHYSPETALLELSAAWFSLLPYGKRKVPPRYSLSLTSVMNIANQLFSKPLHRCKLLGQTQGILQKADWIILWVAITQRSLTLIQTAPLLYQMKMD